MNRIPKSYNVGGQKVEVHHVERCDNNAVGEMHLCSGYLEIAKMFSKDSCQCEASKYNTFIHEVVHSILQTMGKRDLNDDEEFVCTFSSFLCEALTTMSYE